MIKIFKQPKATPATIMFLKGYEEVLSNNGLPYSYISYESPDAFWREMEDCSYFIARWKGADRDLSLMHGLLPEIERKGIKTLPNFNTCYHCGDKYRLAEFFLANDIPTPKTWVFWTEEAAKSWLDLSNKDDYPIVVKLRRGAGSRNVGLLQNKSTADKLIRRFFMHGIKDGELINFSGKINFSNIANELGRRIGMVGGKKQKIIDDCLIFQEFIANNDYDTRVKVIGDRAFGFRRYNRKNDFRASGSGLFDYDIAKIDYSMISTAFGISTKNSFQTMGYDFIYDSHKPVIVEMNYTYPYPSHVSDWHGYWTSNGVFHEVKRSPQYWQMTDLLETELK